MSAALHRHTPGLTVADPRGLPVRQIRFCRSEVDGLAEPRVEAQHYDVPGRPTASWDARLFSTRQAVTDTTANARAIASLSGTPLASDSVDAGWRAFLASESGAVTDEWDGHGTHWHTDHDALLRPVAVHERKAGLPWRTAQRILYAGSDAGAAAHNRCGLPCSHYDDAGLSTLEDAGLFSQPMDTRRHFLAALDLPDWPETSADCDALLEPDEGAATRYRHDAAGDLLTQTDGRGHVRRFTFGVSGQLQSIDLCLAGGTRQTLLRDIRCNALGQVTEQTAGNGLHSTLRYDEASGRLARLTCMRPGKMVQDLGYHQDPVGNILRIRDDAQPTRHFANQRVEPVNRYSYDSLYQLLSATGRETASATVGPVLPELAGLPLDDSQLTHYTQRYRYDAGGNLVELRHEGRQGYTRRMHVAAHSNRALPIIDGQPAPNPLTGFDANGNLLALAPGQALQWDARNQLQRIATVTRTEGDHDDERYMYDSQGARLRKVTRGKAKATQHERDVRYLPGLEVRRDSANDEQLEVVVVRAGLCTVRCLHWITGQPDGIANGQLRYSLADHLGSVSMELDGNAELISQEGYYPYGGTAWWAARSAVEARYKTVRYSGKEREASGLYYYGLRYYAPWLQRWISADPLEAVAGLNLYAMVRNNPIGYVDEQGAQGVVPEIAHFIWMGSALPDDAVSNIKRFMSLNPRHRINLWTDSQRWRTGHGQALENLPGVVNIRRVEDLFRQGANPSLNQFMTAMQSAFERERSGPFRNYPAASDIARTVAVFRYGGIYLDVDVQSNRSLPNPLLAPAGVLLTRERESDGDYTNNSVIAGPAMSTPLRLAALGIASAYRPKGPQSEITWSEKRSFDTRAEIAAQEAVRNSRIAETQASLSALESRLSATTVASRDDVIQLNGLRAELNAWSKLRGVDFIAPRRVTHTVNLTGPRRWEAVLGDRIDQAMLSGDLFQPMNADGNAIVRRPRTLRRASI